MTQIHTHWGSANHLGSTFLGVLLAGTAWRLGWMHALTSSNQHVRGFARAALSQF